MLDLGRFAERIIETREIPGRPGRYAPLPEDLHEALRRALAEVGVERLYSHQDEMVRRARAGDNVVITTGTASGKSLGYLIPTLQRVLDDPSSRAFLLFPTKALGRDQLRGVLRFVESLGERTLQVGVYDGDTPPTERARIRDRANLILTNPDMLNTAFLPNHGRRGFSHVFRNVRTVVVDEMHVYRGAFGAHFANLMRRLRRICAHYGSAPQILASSATIANPQELAETLFAAPFAHVADDGSPSSGKRVYFWQPPLVDDGVRRGVVQEMAQLLPWLVERRQRVIAFCRSRKQTEVVLKETRDALANVGGGHDESNRIAGYRGGYTPEERRQVEQDLLDGRLVGVVSTNALELGIDIGALEVVVQAGFPGTRASFWQQIGRAGRRGREAHALVLLAMTPLDQYIGLDPDWLLERDAEHAVVDPNNLMIELAHLRAAAAELPLTIDDAAVFPDVGEVIPILKDAGELREVYGTYHWSGGPFPAGEFSLRTTDGDRFKIVNRVTGTTLSEMDRPQTYREAHPRAIYLHDGLQYQVETLDLVGHVATVVPVDQNFYTEPDVRTHIEVLLTQERKPLGRTEALFGDVRVDDAVVGFKMLQFHNHQNLGYEVLDEPLALALETEAVWLPIPSDVQEVLGAEPIDTLAGAVHAVVSIASLRTMAERSDVRGTSFHHSDERSGETRVALVLYDTHPGGLGYAAKAYDHLDAIVTAATRLLERCPCRDGCPACVGDYRLDRALVLWCLRSFREELAPPAGGKQPPRPPRPRVERPIGWDELPARWARTVVELTRSGQAGGAALAHVRHVEMRGDKLVLHVASPGVADWLNQDGNRRRIVHLLGTCVRVPKDARIEAVVTGDDRERATVVTDRLRRRYDDLTRE